MHVEPDENTHLDPAPPDEDGTGHDWRQGRFPNLMPRRIQEVLLVSSPYDSFILEEDGLLTEMVFTEYQDLGLTHSPNITRVSTGEEALRHLRRQPFDLVITMLRLGDMDVAAFSDAVHDIKSDLPVVLLVANEWELMRLTQRRRELNVDGVYVWHGDTKIFLAIIKVLEDRMNADHDTRVADVGVIILVEDSVRFRSSLLPIIYAELVKQTRAVMADGLNHMDKLLRMRARPKVVVATNYEEGMTLYDRYKKQLFGVIADVSFPRGGQQDLQAGITFIRHIKLDLPDVPALLQSSDASNGRLAEQIGAQFLHKKSATLLDDVRSFMLNNFGFGEFIFRMPDMREVGRASDLRTMARVLRAVPIESIEYHARRNHFSNWLRARTEFALARRLRPRKVSEFAELETLRRYLIRGLEESLRRNRRGVVEDFSRQRFDSGVGIARIRGGSLGGKARGLAFVDALLAGTDLDREFPYINTHVPRSIVICTDVFDEFLDANRIRLSAICANDDEWIRRAFLAAQLPNDVFRDLGAFLDIVDGPIAVRSSSLLEDSQYHPFAGVYATYMLPNNHPDPQVRLEQLRDTIKLVYASTFYSPARRYLDATPHRIEEEKMAVVVQPIIGARRGDYFYPNFSGVARSYNFYPFGPMKPEDGVVNVALGLGKTVVDGGQSLRFCPAHPQVLPQMADGEAFLNESQRHYYAINIADRNCCRKLEPDRCLKRLDLDAAEAQGTLNLLGSVWCPDNHMFYDGINRPGVRVVTFAHILKNDAFPLPQLLQRLLEIGRTGMNAPVEVEFAVNLDTQPKEFAVLQIRPCGTNVECENVELDELSRDDLLCYSGHALGNGIIPGLADIIYVKPKNFDNTRTPEMAAEIGEINEQLLAENRPYVLIGPGRWGSSHTSLGIPVTWDQICAARLLVETTLQDFVVELSQGSHFFQNLTSFGIGYLAVNPSSDEAFIDWDWLHNQPALSETKFVRHVRLQEPLEGRLQGQRGEAAILKHHVPCAT
jgi:hypothetical protein